MLHYSTIFNILQYYCTEIIITLSLLFFFNPKQTTISGLHNQINISLNCATHNPRNTTRKLIPTLKTPQQDDPKDEWKLASHSPGYFLHFARENLSRCDTNVIGDFTKNVILLGMMESFRAVGWLSYFILVTSRCKSRKKEEQEEEEADREGSMKSVPKESRGGSGGSALFDLYRPSRSTNDWGARSNVGPVYSLPFLLSRGVLPFPV